MHLLFKKYFLNYRSLFFFYLVSRLLILLSFNELPSLFISHYEPAAKNVIAGKGFSVEYEQTLVPLTLYPPGYSSIIAGVYFLAGVNPNHLRVLQIVFLSLCLFLFCKTIEHHIEDQRKAILIGYFYVLNPIFWVQDVSLNTGASLAISFALLGLFFAASFFRHARNYPAMFLAGLFIAVASSIRSEFTLFLVALIGLSLAPPKFNLKGILLFIVGVSVVFVPMSIRNYENFGAISPLPGGTGLAMVNVIGKYYPSNEEQFAFGDGKILQVEGGNFTTLTYPDPYQREAARLHRSLNFIYRNPGKYFVVLLKNLPRAWFGQQLYLSGDDSISFQEYVSSGGGLFAFLKSHPLKFADIVLGFVDSLLLFFAALYFLLTYPPAFKKYSFFIVPAIFFFIFFVPLGTLGRYTLPGYTMLIPLSYLGFEDLYRKAKVRRWRE